MTARETAFQILLHFEQSGQNLDYLTEKSIKTARLSGKELKFVVNLVSGVVRHRTLFDWKISSLFKGNYKKALSKFKIILRLALYEIDFLDFIPPHATVNEYVNLAKKKLPRSNIPTINAIIRTYLRDGKYLKPEKKFKYDNTILAICYSFPEWLIKRWLEFWGHEFVTNMCRMFNERPTFDCRVNEKKIKKEDFKNKLIEENIEFSLSSYFPNVFKITDVQKIRQTNLLSDGFCTIQDESGLIVSRLMNPPDPGDLILDACVAPGGKYTALYENDLRDINLFGLEINQRRLNIVKDNCRRLGYSVQRLVNGDALEPPFRQIFDQILVDAPCTGFGTIQKHPDIKWRRTEEEVSTFHKLQLDILNSVCKCLKPDGFLVYSTCSIDPAENEEVINEFLHYQQGQFVIVVPPVDLAIFSDTNNHIKTFPHQHHMEGSFAVKMQKIS